MQNGNRIYDVSASGETMSFCVDLGSWEAPDLQLRALSVTPEQALPGSPLAIEVNVGNVGQGDAPGSTLRMYVSDDAEIGSDDLEIASSTVAALIAQPSPTVFATRPAPEEAMSFYVGACLDVVSDEADNTNNCVRGQVVDIRPPPGFAAGVPDSGPVDRPPLWPTPASIRCGFAPAVVASRPSTD